MPESTVEVPQYRQILCPVDESHGARRAVAHAHGLAADGATVHLLHVIDEDTRGETPALSSDELCIEAFEEDAHRRLRELAAEFAAEDVDVVLRCARGLPHDEIGAYTEANDIDVIVMGAHGAEPHTSAHAGGTIDRVARSARVPVLVV